MAFPPQTQDSSAVKGISGSSTAPTVQQHQSYCDELLERNKSAPWDRRVWIQLLQLLPKLKVSQARPIAQSATERFPGSSFAWSALINLEAEAGNHAEIVSIFNKVLRESFTADIWIVYLQYLQKHKSGTADGREALEEAFKIALKSVGTDVRSGPIWKSYLVFLNTADADNPRMESIKNSFIRKTYQKAISIPHNAVEEIWRDYDLFENKQDPTLARGLISSHSGKYTAARQVLRQRISLQSDLNADLLAIPPGLTKEVDSQQLALWRRLVQYELTNPLNVDQDIVNTRVILLYNQCLSSFRHYPHIWFELASFVENNSKNKEADTIAVFKRAAIALPKTPVIHFKLADLLDNKKERKEALEVYEDLIKQFEKKEDVPPVVLTQMMRFIRRTEGIQPARKAFLRFKNEYEIAPLFVEGARIEAYVNNSHKAAINLYELGLQTHPQDPSIAIAYCDFLVHLNDPTNTRTVFERVITSVPPEKARELWSQYVTFEASACSDLVIVDKVVKRLRDDDTTTSASFYANLDRYRTGPNWPVLASELTLLENKVSFRDAPASKKNSSKAPVWAGPVPDLGLFKVFTPMPLETPAPPGATALRDSTKEIPFGDSSCLSLVSALLTTLPCAIKYKGPSADPDSVMASLNNFPIPLKNQVTEGDATLAQALDASRRGQWPGRRHF